MENKFQFDYHQHPHMLSCNPNTSEFPFDSDLLKAYPIHRNPNTVQDFTSRNLPLFSISSLQQLIAPLLSSPATLLDFGQKIGPTQPPQKRFLVFDQSGGKTTLLYTSGAHTPVQFCPYWGPNPPTGRNPKEQCQTNNHLRLSSNVENTEDYSQDDTSEDSEELDALLCSDYDTDFSEDDETSTAHSPSTMTDDGLLNRAGETCEEVDSFLVPSKKRKLPEVGCDVACLETGDCSALESDAESSCGDGKEDCNLFSGGKRLRGEKIHETVSVLKSIVPNANGKDAIVVIDEAIRYLKSLKTEAKALGLDTV